MTKEAMQAEIEALRTQLSSAKMDNEALRRQLEVTKREYDKIAAEYRGLSDMQNARAAGLGMSKRGETAQDNAMLTVQGQFARRLSLAIMRLVAKTPEDATEQEE